MKRDYDDFKCLPFNFVRMQNLVSIVHDEGRFCFEIRRQQWLVLCVVFFLFFFGCWRTFRTAKLIRCSPKIMTPFTANNTIWFGLTGAFFSRFVVHFFLAFWISVVHFFWCAIERAESLELVVYTKNKLATIISTFFFPSLFSIKLRQLVTVLFRFVCKKFCQQFIFIFVFFLHVVLLFVLICFQLKMCHLV